MNAVIYARYSSDNQREESIEGQLRDCREYAKQNKLAIVETILTGHCLPERQTARIFRG